MISPISHTLPVRHQAKPQATPNFKGGIVETLPKFLGNGVYDVAVIAIACVIADVLSRNINKKKAKEYGQKQLKHSHSKKFASISNQTENLIGILDKKQATKLDKSFRESFNAIPQKRGLGTYLGTRNEQVLELLKTVDNLMMEANNADTYDAVGKPFLKILSSIKKKV